MIKVEGNLDLRVLPNGSWCELLAPIEVTVDDITFTVPIGTQTDFASVPRIFWTFIPPMGLHTMAAVAHDYLYRTGAKSKQIADEVFYKLMRYYGVGGLKARLMWWAVHRFGAKAYKG